MIVRTVLTNITIQLGVVDVIKPFSHPHSINCQILIILLCDGIPSWLPHLLPDRSALAIRRERHCTGTVEWGGVRSRLKINIYKGNFIMMTKFPMLYGR